MVNKVYQNKVLQSNDIIYLLFLSENNKKVA